MNSKQACLALALAWLVGGSAHAEGTWRDWVPFANKESAATSSTKKSGITPASRGSRSRAGTRSKAGEKPGVLARMGNSSKQFWARTRDTFSSSSEAEPAPKRQGGQHVNWDDPIPQKKKPAEEKSSMFSWFGREEPRPSRTVGEFLNQPRP